MRAAGLAALACAALLALGACGDGSSQDAPAALAGTQWELDGAGNGAVSVYLMFGDEERVSGSDGCNDFSGPYEADGSSLRFGPLASTQRACVGTAQQVATKVSQALAGTRSYAVRSGALVLQDEDGKPLLRYSASTPGVAGRWDVVSVLYDDAIRSVVVGTTLTADFRADGKVTGSGGCNTFSGPYRADRAKLRIGPLVSTRRACSKPEGAAAQEAGYFAALESVVRIEQAAGRLTLFNAEGQMAVTLTRAR